MRTRALAPLSLGAACALAAAAACGGGGGGEAPTEDAPSVSVAGASGAAGKAGGASAGAAGKAGNGGKGGGFQQTPDTVGIVIEPAAATITVVDGVAKPLALVAKAKLADGSIGAPVAPTWEIDLGDVAAVDKNGSVAATGARGGVATVKATLGPHGATSTVTVKLSITLDPGKLSAGDKAKLAAATDADPAVSLMYPYDGTVFPRGLAPPRLMWKPAPAAPMMLTLKAGLAEVTTTFVPTGAALDPDPAAWTKLVESGNGGPVEVTLARLTGGQAKLVTKQTWRVASGSLKGTVYYWANSLGAVVRIKPGASAPDNFLKAAGVTDGCTTCHAVSANGNVLTLGGGGPAEDSKASVFDLVSGKLVASNRGRAWAMLALTPDGKIAALNNAPLPGSPGLDGGFYDVATGAKLTGSGFDKELFDMPAFAPDGSKLVYVDHATKALVSLGYSDATGKPVASGKVSLVPGGASPIAFPVVSPDAKWAVYHRGPLDTRDGPADLVAASALAPGAEVPLDATNGKTYPFAAGDRDRHLNYEPAFLPVASGGYFWLVFTSRRTLGNDPNLTGASGQVKQLWVAAFDQHPQPGKDPSHPAFWLSGQDAKTLNMRAYWALDPCKADGQTCSVGSECCGGSCLSGDGGMVCGKPPGQSCSPSGGACKSAADCCGKGFTCINSHCAEPDPE
ncbi:MAG: hypothetical protein IT374_01165 [Polyangiaceae bacterium]|nr:hypothetical protein [Polyangiaceae bacterium]